MEDIDLSREDDRGGDRSTPSGSCVTPTSSTSSRSGTRKTPRPESDSDSEDETVKKKPKITPREHRKVKRIQQKRKQNYRTRIKVR